mmetsp:Transcript_10738/g.23331  ORF Transcript_10738/g.23331 Transcript_10738/m.23331 type:complete len:342 (-) Transcript_10738:54-1079(-)
MPRFSFDLKAWRPQLKTWWAGLMLFQLGILVSALALADASGPGLAKYPTGMMAWVGGVAYGVMVFELGAVSAAGWPVGVGVLKGLAGTVMNVVDVGTDGLSAVSIIAASWSDVSRLEDSWRAVVSQSILPCHVPLWLLAGCAWSAGGLQFLAAWGALMLQEDWAPALAADLMGFETLTFLAAEAAGGDDDAEEQRTEEEQDELDAGRRVVEIDADARVWVKLLLRLLIENLFQLHLQLTCIGLSVALSGWSGAARSMLLSVSISAFFLTMKLLQAVPTMTSILAGTAAHIRHDPIESRLCYVGVPCVPTLLLVAYAAAKFWALFQCPQHLLNVTGCVELDL